MDLLSLFTATVFAAETAFSPIPKPTHRITNPTKPQISFADLTVNFVKSIDWTDLPGSIAIPPTQLNTKKTNYTIALLGDSMIDTLGPNLPHLSDELKTIYPKTKFNLLNYGVGGTNIEYGIERITHDYTYLGNNFPSLISQKPDVVVIESFGYNPLPYDIGAIDQHWLKLSQAVALIKKQLPKTKIVIATTIAPNAKVFGDGAPGIAFSATDKQKRVSVIKKYLENAIRFAQSQKLPIANAFHPSLDSNGIGKPELINSGDHIHYSDNGRKFFSEIIAKTIADNKLLE